MTRELRCVPNATVRLQIHAGFDLDAAASVVPYYAALGISHYYVSPLQQSRAGSAHGYDGIDPARVDPLRGGRAGLQRLVARLREHGMGLVLDIVPNHQSSSLENPWWYDVLERGRASRYADYFAIDWAAPDAPEQTRVLLPVLTESLDERVSARAIALVWDGSAARLCIGVDDEAYPLHAAAHAGLLVPVLPDVADDFARADDDASLQRARLNLWSALQARSPREKLTAHLQSVSADPGSLRALLQDQYYELAHWQDASTRINWRRFFDINELVALRSEDERVFDACHALVFELYAAGEIDGVRIDHVDGLADPAAYLARLRARFDAVATQRPQTAATGPAWIVVEKILASDETLQPTWPVDGSTGYEFMDQVSALLHDSKAAPALDTAWADHGGLAWPDIVVATRAEVLDNAFGAELERLCRDVATLHPDLPGADIREAVHALLVQYRRYRGYAVAGVPDSGDQATLAAAAEAAVVHEGVDAALIAKVVRCVSGGTPGEADGRTDAAIAAFQQLSAPLAARAIEDTAFYRHARLLSRNEVGADPGHLSLHADAFHRHCSTRAAQWPNTLLCTASHDHKRGEDARMRIATLTDVPSLWQGWLQRQSFSADGTAPDSVDRMQLFQSMAGMGGAIMREHGRERLREWQVKAIRERKVHGSWAVPDPGYETASAEYLRDLLDDRRFVTAFEPLLHALDLPAAVRSLAQTVLRCTTPGIPDLYQGTEFWDLSFVDPDNRRDVDYRSRMEGITARDDDVDLLAGWRDGRVKQRLLQRLLQTRSDVPALFGGSYHPVAVDGPLADRFIAFERRHARMALLVVVPIRPHELFDNAMRLIAKEAASTYLGAGSMVAGWDVVHRTRIDSGRSRSSLADLLHTWPVCVVVRAPPW